MWLKELEILITCLYLYYTFLRVYVNINNMKTFKMHKHNTNIYYIYVNLMYVYYSVGAFVLFCELYIQAPDLSSNFLFQQRPASLTPLA